MTDERHPPAIKRHPSTEGNCSTYSPIEGNPFDGVFRIDPHATLVAPVEDENTDSEIVPPLVKGVRGI